MLNIMGRTLGNIRNSEHFCKEKGFFEIGYIFFHTSNSNTLKEN